MKIPKGFNQQQRDWIRKQIKKAKAEGMREGAERMFDYVVLAGVEIDGVEYLKLNDVCERADSYLKELK